MRHRKSHRIFRFFLDGTRWIDEHHHIDGVTPREFDFELSRMNHRDGLTKATV